MATGIAARRADLSAGKFTNLAELDAVKYVGTTGVVGIEYEAAIA